MNCSIKFLINAFNLTKMPPQRSRYLLDEVDSEIHGPKERLALSSNVPPTTKGKRTGISVPGGRDPSQVNPELTEALDDAPKVTSRSFDSRLIYSAMRVRSIGLPWTLRFFMPIGMPDSWRASLHYQKLRTKCYCCGQASLRCRPRWQDPKNIGRPAESSWLW